MIVPRLLRPLPADHAISVPAAIGRVPLTLIVTRDGGFIGEVLARLIVDDGRWDRCGWLREPPTDPTAVGQAIVDALGLRCPVRPGDAGASSVEQAFHACASGGVLVIELPGRCPNDLAQFLAGARQHAEQVDAGIIIATGSPVPAALASIGSLAVAIDTAGIARAEARQMGLHEDTIDRILRLMRGRDAVLHDLAAVAGRWPVGLIESAATGTHIGRTFLRRVSGLFLDECGVEEREALDIAVRTGYWHPRFSTGSVPAEALRPWVVPLEHEWGWVRPIWRRPLSTQIARRGASRPPIQIPADQPVPIVLEVWQPVLDVRLLGGFEVRVDGQLVEGLSIQLSARLLRYLVLRPNRSCPRDELIEAFWPNSDPYQARNRLQVALSALRKTMRAATDIDVVEFTDGRYGINPELGLSIDVVEFERLAAIGFHAHRLADAEAALDADRKAIGLYRGDLCADLPYEEWTIFPRERLRMLYGDILDRLSDLQWRTADYDGCTVTARRMLEQDPCREDAHRLLMRCYAAQGQTHQALRQFDACRRMLKAKLEAIPSTATVTLYLDIRDQGDGVSP